MTGREYKKMSDKEKFEYIQKLESQEELAGRIMALNKIESFKKYNLIPAEAFYFFGFIEKIELKLGIDVKITSFEILGSLYGEGFHRYKINGVTFNFSEFSPNIDRTRKYGVKIGDIVFDNNLSDKKLHGVVVPSRLLDNNSCYVAFDGFHNHTKCVAEDLVIVEKVEDRIEKYEKDFYQYIKKADIETIEYFEKLKIIHGWSL